MNTLLLQRIFLLKNNIKVTQFPQEMLSKRYLNLHLKNYFHRSKKLGLNSLLAFLYFSIKFLNFPNYEVNSQLFELLNLFSRNHRNEKDKI